MGCRQAQPLSPDQTLFSGGCTVKTRKNSLLAWSLFGLIILTAFLSLAANLANLPDDANIFNVVEEILWILLSVEFGLVASLIVARQPGNIIGWLLMLPALLSVIDFFGRGYLEQFPTAPAEPTVMLLLVSWFANASWLLLIFPLLFTMLLFPNGRPPSARWRWIVPVGVSMMAVFTFGIIFSATIELTELNNWVLVNPIGFLPTESESFFTVWAVALAALTLLCGAAPLVRYRRASGVERQQIKWLFYAGGLFVLIYVPGFVITNQSGTLLLDAWLVLFVLALMAFPAAIAIAVTRYRLYDIDIIVRRTLVYAILTGLLALVYFGTVVLLQTLFEAAAGQRSPIIIVISTLLIAALFTPLRRRVQRAIDRRFFRQKYDAVQVLAQFAETARDEVDLDALTASLLKVLRETMEPERVTLWFKEDAS